MRDYEILHTRMQNHAKRNNLRREQHTGRVLKPKHGLSYHFELYMEPHDYVTSIFLDDTLFQKCSGNLNKLVRFLKEIPSTKFPFIKRDRNYIGFANGILDLKSCIFKTTNEDGIIVRHFIDSDLDIDSLSTPMFDKLLLDQFPANISTFDGVIAFIMMSIGRLFFKVKELDNWGYILVLLGESGRGKSTLGNIVKAMFSNVGFLNSSFNKKTGLSDLYDKDIIIADDLPKNIKSVLPQQEFQTMVTGGGINVNRKYRSSIFIDWVVPLLILTNYRLNYNDDMGQISRRIMIAVFSYEVPHANANLEMEIIKNELPAIIYKCVTKYKKAREEHFNSRVQDFCPEYFNRDIQSEQEDLSSFIQTSLDEGKISIRQGALTKLSDFNDCFQMLLRPDDETILQEICKDWSITKPNICKSCEKRHIVGCCDAYERKNRSQRGYYINNLEIVDQAHKKRRVG